MPGGAPLAPPQSTQSSQGLHRFFAWRKDDALRDDGAAESAQNRNALSAVVSPRGHLEWIDEAQRADRQRRVFVIENTER